MSSSGEDIETLFETILEQWPEPPLCPAVSTPTQTPPGSAIIDGSPGGSAPIEVLDGPTQADKRKEKLLLLEDSILEESLVVLEASTDWAEAVPDDPDIPGEPPELPRMPESWLEKYGEEGARRRWRIARSAALPTRDAPVGLSLAMKTAVGIMAAREKRGSANVQVNVALVQMPAPPQFEEIDVSE